LPIAGLRLGIYYTFTIKAVNGNGDSAASDPSTPISIGIAPSYLFIRSIVPNYKVGETLVYITYPDDGGSPITKYQYSYNNGPFYDLSGFTTPFSIYNLPQNELLMLRIKAINIHGETISVAKPVTVVTGPPLRMNDVYTSIQNRQMVVTFKPIANNGSEIISYNYLLYRNGVPDASYVSVAPVQPIVIGNLENNVSYGVQLYATNGLGNAIPSSVTIGKTYVASPPSTPVIFTIRSTPGQAQIYLLEPQSLGSPIQYYSYSLDGGSFVDTSNGSSSFTITGLQNNVVYNIRVTATNDTGTSQISRTHVFRVNYNVPTRPTLVRTYTQLADGFTVRFMRPNNNNGSAITGYKYRLNGGEWVDAGIFGGSFITVSGLAQGTYLMELVAVNGVGEGAVSFPRVYSTL